MSNGILAVWSDIDAVMEDEYTAWYEREHMYDRLVVPGFHRARHYVTVYGAPKYFTYYVTDDAAVMASAAYLASANHPTPWTQRILPHFRNTNRTACNVVRRLGRGYGAVVLTVRLAAVAGRETALLTWIGETQLPALIQQPGILAVQIWHADREATWLPVTDRSLRPEPDQVADLVVFIEATTRAPLTRVASEALSPASLTTHGATTQSLVAIHQFLNGAERLEPAAM